MKKLLAMICAFLMCCFLGGCEKEETKDTTSSEPSDSDTQLEIPDLENMTEEELLEYFSSYPFDFDEPIVLPDDE